MHCSHWKGSVEIAKLWTWALFKVNSSNHHLVMESRLIHLMDGLRIYHDVSGRDIARFMDQVSSGKFPKLRRVDISHAFSPR